MKYLILLLCFLRWGDAFPQRGKVVIRVNGVQATKGGAISVGFFTKEDFPRVSRQAFGTRCDVTAESMEVVFEQVPAGEYGVAVFQDIDKNQVLRTNLIGVPTEPVGFSNDARIRFGPPSFDDARITVVSGETLKLVIQLR